MSFRNRRAGRLVGRVTAATAALSLVLLGGGAASALASAQQESAASPPVAAAETVGGITTVDDVFSQYLPMLSLGIAGNVLSNDTGDGLKIIAVEGETGAEVGTVTFTDSRITYKQPGATSSSVETFVYTVQDANNTTATGRVSFAVRGPMPAPDIEATVQMAPWDGSGDEASIFRVYLADLPEWAAMIESGLMDSDGTRDYSVVPWVDGASASGMYEGGTLRTGSTYIEFRAAPGYYGTQVMQYMLTDGYSQYSPVAGTITIEVVPELVATTAATTFGTPISIPVLQFTTGTNSVTEGVTIEAENGTVEIVDGVPIYTPNPGFYGVDTFTVRTFSDETGWTAMPLDVHVTVTVLEPQVVTDQTRYNTPRTVDLTSTGTVETTYVGQPEHGTVEIVNGEVVYTPTPGYVGEDSFVVSGLDADGQLTSITVELTVAPPDDQELSTRTPFETPKTIDVLGETGATEVTSTGQGSNGSVTVVDGQVVYTPNPGFSGEDSFTVTVTDEYGTPITVVVDVTVGEELSAAAETPYETPVTIDVLDQTGGVELTGTGQGQNGSAEIVDGQLVYTPNPGFVGEDVVIVTMTDENGDPVDVPVTITVAGPEAVELNTTTPYQTPKTVDVLGESGAESIDSVGQGSNGSVEIVDGEVVYTPNPGFSGEDTFTATVLDEHGTPIEVVVTVTVDEPLAAEDDVDYNTPKIVEVPGESVTGVEDGEHGTVEIDEDGNVVYTPEPGFIGEDTFTVSVIDENGDPATVLVTVNVGGPDPVDLATTTPFETPKTIDVLGESGTESITSAGQGENGTVTVNPDGTVTYTPNPGFTGVDEFVVTVTDEYGNPVEVTVEVSVGDVVETATDTDYNTPVVVDPKTETDGGEITDVRDGDNGTVTVNPDGTVTYTPNPGFVGEDEFTVIVTDEDGESTAVVVTVTVAAPEDVETGAVTPYETPVSVDVLDVSGGAAIESAGQGSNGSVTVVDGEVVYTPNPGFSGEDTFTVTVTDEYGTPFDVVVTVTVGDLVELTEETPYNTPKEIEVPGTPSEATDGEHGTVTINPDGTVTYTPEPGFVGEDTFTVEVTDEDGNPSTVEVTVNVAGPEPIDVVDETDYNTPKVIEVPEGELTETTDGEHGTVTVDENGNVVYTPEPGFVGEDTFTVTVTDEHGNEQEVTVTVTVNGPESIEVTDQTGYETPKVIEVPGGATDATDGSNGTVTVNPDGTVTYTPNPGFSGEDTFTVTVIDEFGNEQQVTVTVTVDPPATSQIAKETPYETGSTIDILGETGAVEISSVTQGQNGTVEIVDGKIVYTPNPGFSGVDTFTVTVINADGTRTVVTITMTVGDPAAAPGDPGTKTGVLAITGSDAGLLALIGAGVAALGIALTMVTRRRRSTVRG